jgi:pimeloyl-ACP methyl ester carboxylesterase
MLRRSNRAGTVGYPRAVQRNRRPRPDDPVVAPEGAPVTVETFTYAGATLVAERFGRGAQTFVLVHGIGMGRSVFRGVAEQLENRGTFIAIDLPGYGAAPEPERVLTMERTADLVAAYLRGHAPGPVVLVGHSMGTQVVAEVAARHPHLVDRLVLLAPTVNRREHSAVQQVLRLAQDLAGEHPKVFLIGAREYLRAGPNLRKKFRAMMVHRPEDAYRAVICPTLVIRGETDRVCPREWCRHVGDLVPDGELVEIAGHGHETMIRDSGPAAAAILRFTER